jgi:hypothetical protein
MCVFQWFIKYRRQTNRNRKFAMSCFTLYMKRILKRNAYFLRCYDVGLLGCNALWTCRQIRTFRRNTLSPPSGVNMEAVCFSETLATLHKSKRLFNPKDQIRHFHRRENLKSHLLLYTPWPHHNSHRYYVNVLNS